MLERMKRIRTTVSVGASSATRNGVSNRSLCHEAYLWKKEKKKKRKEKEDIIISTLCLHDLRRKKKELKKKESAHQVLDGDLGGVQDGFLVP
jgi:hypothetical protein